MRVFHLVNADHGLDDLRKRRLKISTLDELNDPFEFLGVSLADERLRHAFNRMKSETSMRRGLLCFSRDWHNPVLWSHYAAKHSGLCLGFDVPEKLLGSIHYSTKRLSVDAESLADPRSMPVEMAKKLLFTKFSHWRYEQEVRCFVTLETQDPETAMYFAPFSEELRLTTVIVGAQSNLSRKDVGEALGELAPFVEAFKARLAFRSFRVVRQRRSSLWV